VRWTAISSADTFRATLLSAEARGFVVVPEGENLSVDAFALEVQDDSMVDPGGSPYSLYPGDTVIVDPDRKAQPGNMVLARDGKKAMIRKLRIVAENDHGSRIALVPLNPDFATKETTDDFIVGVMAAFYRRSN
jgi:SOS-response transcriptional repressor LexA